MFPSGGTTNGRVLWPIPWEVKVHDVTNTNGEFEYHTANHLKTYRASDRSLRVEKCNRSAQRKVP